jgi:tetratricopeptide (TPR) repeat protein
MKQLALWNMPPQSPIFLLKHKCQLGQIYLIKQNDILNSKATSTAKEVGAKGWANMDKCLDEGGAGTLVVPEVVKEAIDHYIDLKDTDKVIALYNTLIGFEPNNTQYLITLARIYAEKGDKEDAIATANKVGVVDPKLKADADEFVKQVQNAK